MKGLMFAWLAVAVSVGCANAAQLARYENQALGLSIECPKGWNSMSGDEIDAMIQKSVEASPDLKNAKQKPPKHSGILVAFSQEPFGSTADVNPMITLSSEKPVASTTPLAYAQAALQDFKKSFPDTRAIRGPAVVTIGGRPGASFVYECTVQSKDKPILCKGAMYFFLQGKTGIMIACSDTAAGYNAKEAQFLRAVNSLVLK